MLARTQIDDLFSCLGSVNGNRHAPAAAVNALQLDAERQIDAALTESMERGRAHVSRRRAELCDWAKAMVRSREKELEVIEKKLRALRSTARQMEKIARYPPLGLRTTNVRRRRNYPRVGTPEEHERILKKIAATEAQKARKIGAFDRDVIAINGKRDQLIESLERQPSPRIEREVLFTIRWAVV